VRKQKIALTSDLQDGQAVKFSYSSQNRNKEGLLVRWHGEWRAYENTCQHLPLSLDNGDGRFFAQNGQVLLCRNHGALFDPLTGLCLKGPCQGARLRPLSIELSAGAVWLAGTPE
jgi:nitrite reductase/ring-hydroxylating ferredoxin subunit